MNSFYDVLVIGAGISGIGAGHYLKKNCPNKSFAIQVLAKESGLSDKTIKRLLAKNNKPTYQTIFKIYSVIFETSTKKIDFKKKISDFENFDSLKIFEIINFFSNEKKDINPNKINDKTKFIDLYKYYDK